MRWMNIPNGCDDGTQQVFSYATAGSESTTTSPVMKLELVAARGGIS